MNHPLPRLLGEPSRFVDELLAWMSSAGATRYDESVTQFEHALQSAALAMQRGNPRPLVLASFLHDVGHLLADEHDGHADFLARNLHHERIGARWLARAFGPDITEPIRMHVDAKRYLCAVDAAYHASLSASSKRSLLVQGGPMAADEAARFEAQPHAAAAVELRRIDDLAKRVGHTVPPAAIYREALNGAIAATA